MRRVLLSGAVMASGRPFSSSSAQVLSEASVPGEHLCHSKGRLAVPSVLPCVETRQNRPDQPLTGTGRASGQFAFSSAEHGLPGPKSDQLHFSGGAGSLLCIFFRIQAECSALVKYPGVHSCQDVKRGHLCHDARHLVGYGPIPPGDSDGDPPQYTLHRLQRLMAYAVPSYKPPAHTGAPYRAMKCTTPT